MAVTSWLLDKSVFVKLQLDQVVEAEVWKTQNRSGPGADLDDYSFGTRVFGTDGG